MNTDFYTFLAQGQSFRMHRLLPSTHAHGEADEKKHQAGVSKYRAQILDCVQYACAWRLRTRWRCAYTDRQRVNPLTDLAQTFIRTYIHDDKTVYHILSI
ncbi:hypothetical protein AVEN_171981-1 [Araneus ventricosus]|uniref:Uncharacterized protein n=1 Tax=Araneus ventricosus TaxID=182803 RepID=A0A4Y2Q8G1_ARAVE|nr:hypothetical protein AVEN_171981-1 [Araneus ventricosus]